MPLTNAGYRTFAPFDKRIQKAMRTRAYSVKVIWQSGKVSEYKSSYDFYNSHGKDISYIRSRVIYAEMFIGDSVNATWYDENQNEHSIIFTRIR